MCLGQPSRCPLLAHHRNRPANTALSDWPAGELIIRSMTRYAKFAEARPDPEYGNRLTEKRRTMADRLRLLLKFAHGEENIRRRGRDEVCPGGAVAPAGMISWGYGMSVLAGLPIPVVNKSAAFSVGDRNSVASQR